MIIYHSRHFAGFPGNHVFLFGFQPLFLKVITVTSAAPAPTTKPFIIGGGVGRAGSIIG